MTYVLNYFHIQLNEYNNLHILKVLIYKFNNSYITSQWQIAKIDRRKKPYRFME
jgi:hypothetical protein